MNKPIARMFVLVLVLFAALVVFTSRWTIFDAAALRDNPLNHRALIAQQLVPRGRILAADGTVLARSVRRGDKTYTRRYPQAGLFAHAVGYSFVRQGQAGLEQLRNDALSGNGPGQGFLSEFTNQTQPGDTVRTTLDPKAQAVALRELGGRPGAVVALDPATGAVKVMASVPTYDPNKIPSTLTQLNQEASAPIFNRVTQGRYPPGSTFKTVTTVAAIDSGRYTPDSIIDGSSPKVIGGVPLMNDGGESFGPITLTKALTFSVNTVYAQVGETLGKRTMGRYMRRFGFYDQPPLDYPPSQIAASGEFYNGHLLPVTSDRVDVGRMAIGQDKLEVAPLQMAMVAAAIANHGRLMRPHLTDRIVDPDGRTVEKVEPRLQSRVMSPRTSSQVTEMMRHVVNEGTGTAAALQGIDVAGKTGTASVGPQGAGLTQPWFIAFAPAEHPKVAVAVTIERTNGGFGGTVAAPIAKDVMESLLH